MKSLVALLDRKKRDRANTLVQVPFPSTLPHTAALQQETPSPASGGRRTSIPSSFLRPRLQHQSTSSASLVQYPPFTESSAFSRGHSPAQSGSYYTDSDDGTFADPFAAAPPARVDSTASKASNIPTDCQSYSDGPKSASMDTAPSGSSRFRTVHGAVSCVMDESSHSGAMAPSGKKGRRLRERRSLSSLLRPQPSTLTELVPTVPPLPDRVPELKASFFIRGRSGSISAASQRTQLTHTFQQQFTAPAPVQLQTSATHRPRSTVKELKNITPSRNSISGPLEPSSTVGSRSSDPWVRVGGVGSERSLSNSPTSVRRRVASVPTRPPRLIEPHPPMPNEQHISRVQGSEADCSTMPSQELSSVRRPGTSAECSARPGRNGHGVKSASVSIPVSYGARTSAGARPSEQERSSLKHLKQSSMSASEGLVLKSALKYRSAEQPIQTHQKPLAGRVEPMNTSRRSAGLELDSSRLPIPPSEDTVVLLEPQLVQRKGR